MSDIERAFITLGAQVGGQDAHEATKAHILALRRLLTECSGPYGDAIKEIALVLRIDGEIDACEREGIDGVVWRSTKCYATADIWITRDAWSKRSPAEFRSFLASEVQAAIAKIIKHVAKRKVPLASDALERDVARAARRFVSS